MKNEAQEDNLGAARALAQSRKEDGIGEDEASKNTRHQKTKTRRGRRNKGEVRAISNVWASGGKTGAAREKKEAQGEEGDKEQLELSEKAEKHEIRKERQSRTNKKNNEQLWPMIIRKAEQQDV